MHFLADYLAYLAVKLLSLIFISMPAGMALACGRAIGAVAYYIDVKHKLVAYDNLGIAFSFGTLQERKRIVKKLFQNFALSIIELLRLPVTDRRYFEKYIEIEGQEHINQALKGGKGLIFLAMHFGSWELSNVICPYLGLTYKVMAREQTRFSRLYKLLNSYRESQGTQVVTRGITTRDIIKSLQRNEAVGMVADQGAKDGSLVDFFGKDASMPTGAIRMALKFDVPILIAFIVRKQGLFHKVIIRPVFQLEKSADFEQDVLTNLRQVAKIAEEVIRIYPEQYMWFYKIWKYSLGRSIVILDDGKTGHLRQSQALANMLSLALKKQGISPAVTVLAVNFKNKFFRQLVAFSCFLAQKRHCKGCLWCLHNFLCADSFDKIKNLNADFVISCGQANAPVNFIYAAERSAKSIAILSPGVVGFKRFDLVVMPEHDRPLKRNNLAITKGAPNLISEECLKNAGDWLIKSFPALADGPKLKIGLLMGGNTKKYSLTPEITIAVLRGIKKICEEFDLQLLTTSSRRTPREVEGLLKEGLSGLRRSSLLIIANENNHPAAIGGILSLAQIAVVSGESISMISEAASSGKTVVVFRLRPRFGFDKDSDKHERFLRNLARQGFIYLTQANKLEETLREILKHKKTTQKLDDNLAIEKALEKIL